jgi:hypothetical protein
MLGSLSFDAKKISVIRIFRLSRRVTLAGSTGGTLLVLAGTAALEASVAVAPVHTALWAALWLQIHFLGSAVPAAVWALAWAVAGSSCRYPVLSLERVAAAAAGVHAWFVAVHIVVGERNTGPGKGSSCFAPRWRGGRRQRAVGAPPLCAACDGGAGDLGCAVVDHRAAETEDGMRKARGRELGAGCSARWGIL